jgi:hypothetical protein
MAPVTLTLDTDSIALVESAHSAKAIAMATAGCRATLTHAYAARVAPDQRRVTVTVDRTQAGPVLAALEQGRRIAMVATDVRSFRSVQLKGDDACLVEPSADDRARAAAHGAEFARIAAEVGFEEQVIRAHMHCCAAEVIAIAFTVSQAFIQTPGPMAGQPLASAR